MSIASLHNPSEKGEDDPTESPDMLYVDIVIM